MCREPVLVTKNNRPVGFMISIEDAADTLIPEMFMQKEPGYEECLQAKVGRALEAFKEGTPKVAPHDAVTSRVWERVKRKVKSTPA